MVARPAERSLPPVTPLVVASMILVIIGGIYLASYLPHTAPLATPIALLIASAIILLWSVVSLARVREFAWDRFFQVGGWALLAYAVIAGMLEYVFVVDGTPGSLLILLTLMLLIYAVDVPLILAFSVARYQQEGDRTEGG